MSKYQHIYAAIHQIDPGDFRIIAMWSVGPVRLSGSYKTRDEARRASIKIMGKHRRLVFLPKLYKIHDQRIRELFRKSRKPKPVEEVHKEREDATVFDCFECNLEGKGRKLPISLREERYDKSGY